MAVYFVESVKCGVGNGGMACGPVGGPVVAEIKVRGYENKEFYLSLAEVDGIPNFFQTDRSTIREQLNKEWDDSFADYLHDHYIEIASYEELFEKEYTEWTQLLRYLMYIVRADWDDFNKYKDAVINRYIYEIFVPMSDLEEEYLDEIGEYDDEDDEDDEYDDDDDDTDEEYEDDESDEVED